MRVAAKTKSLAEANPIQVGYLLSPDATARVTVAREYAVLGVVLFRFADVIVQDAADRGRRLSDQLNILIADDDGRPSWLPVTLFEVTDPQLPHDWWFRWFTDEEPGIAGRRGVRGLWGYRELVEDWAHYVGLVEEDPASVAAFRARTAHD